MQKTNLFLIMSLFIPVLLTAQSSVYYRNQTSDNKGNTAFGQALGLNGGTYNVGIGLNALSVNVLGIQNTAIGVDALRFNTTGERNLAIGTKALQNNNGNGNIAVGFSALSQNIMGEGNIATGNSCLFNNTIGNYNWGGGAAALLMNTTGNRNIALGTATLMNNNGNDNVAIGIYALHSNNNGNYNTAIGTQADVTSGNLVNATAIGYNAKVNLNNKVRIGNVNVTRIEGNVNWSVFSDARMKSNIQNSELGLNFITKLRPVNYHYKHDSTLAVYTGFLAQEVEAAVAASGQKEFSAVLKPQQGEDHYSLRYAEFVVPLVKAVQEQQQIIDTQQEKIQSLEQRLKDLELFVKKPVENATDHLKKVELKQSRPNPAKGQAQIDYFIPTSARQAVLNLFDMSGKLLQSHPIEALGEGSLTIETKNLAAGTYIYNLMMDGKEAISKKMVVAAE